MTFKIAHGLATGEQGGLSLNGSFSTMQVIVLLPFRKTDFSQQGSFRFTSRIFFIKNEWYNDIILMT